MKVGVIALRNLELAAASAIRIVEITNNIANLGCSVTLFSPGNLPYDLDKKVNHIKFNRPYIPLQLLHLYNIRTNMFKPLRYIISNFPELSKLTRERFDIIHCHQLAAASFAFVMKEYIETPILYDIHGLISLQQDIWSRNTKYSYRLSSLSQIALLRKLDAISVGTSSIKQFLIDSFRISENKIFVIPDGVNINFSKTTILEDNNIRLITNLSIEGKKILMYIGSFSYIHGTLNLVKSLDIINNSNKDIANNIILVLIGQGQLINSIKQYIDENNIKNIIIIDTIPHDHVSTYLNLADILVIPNPRTKSNELSDYMKTYEYLASGKPIVATDVGYTGKLLKENDLALVVDPTDPKFIAEGIVELLKNENLAKHFGTNGHNYISHEHTWEKSAETTVEAYKMIVNRFKEKH